MEFLFTKRGEPPGGHWAVSLWRHSPKCEKYDPTKMPQEKETKGPRTLYTKVEYVDPSAVRRPHRKSAATARPAGARSYSKTARGVIATASWLQLRHQNLLMGSS